MYKSNINLNLYKTFYDVAKNGSISKAAQYSYTSQPAISKSIKRLEEELEVQLFYRNLNGVELTEKGKELLYYVEKSYNNLLTAKKIMLETDALERGNLSIGMPSNIGSFFLFDKIIDFHKKYPKIEITIITGSTSKLLSLLNSHKVDFVIDTSPIEIELDNDVKIAKLAEVQYCFVAKKDLNKNYKNITKLKDLENEQLILPIPGTANRNDLDKLLIKNEVKFKDILNIHTSEMIISAIKKGLGIGYLIYNLVENDIEKNDLEILNIKEKLPTVEINILYDKELLTTTSKKFIKDYIEYNF